MKGKIPCEPCDGINDAHRTIRVEEKMASPLERLSMMTSPVSPRCISFSLILPAAHRQSEVIPAPPIGPRPRHADPERLYAVGRGVRKASP